MVIRNRRQPQVPLYQQRWEGKHVKWFDGERWPPGPGPRPNLYKDQDGQTIMLRVARDDGYIQPGVRVEWVMESSPGGL